MNIVLTALMMLADYTEEVNMVIVGFILVWWLCIMPTIIFIICGHEIANYIDAKTDEISARTKLLREKKEK